MRTIRRAIGLLIALVSCLVILFAAVGLLRPTWLQEIYTSVLPYYEVSLPAVDPAGRAGTDRAASRAAVRVTPGTPIGTLEIPRLGLSSVVLEGDEEAALVFGVGHLSDTPLPWHNGNSVLAAHRDTFFKPLEHIKPNDVIRLSTDQGEFEYVVQGARIVEPTAVEVLAPTTTSRLTLITCYPFNYVGPAPKRFVVQAERVES
jgi:LPXTG-site transpeptidase (sortase) family protein